MLFLSLFQKKKKNQNSLPLFFSPSSHVFISLFPLPPSFFPIYLGTTFLPFLASKALWHLFITTNDATS